jgi:alpha-1,2-mannosyltransferase
VTSPPERSEQPARWRFTRGERIALAVALFFVLLFGANLERRTALRRVPMTDLGVFSCAAWAVWSGGNLYTISDWHGWHYQYPPTMAILFTPLAHPLPTPLPALAPGEQRTPTNTPWGYGAGRGQSNRYGFHKDNARFFCIVAAWYAASIFLFLFSAHAIACVLDGTTLRTPLPLEQKARRRWWALRWWPLLICAGSVGTELSRGQVDVLMLAAIALGLYMAAARKEIKAGLLFAFPATVKLVPPFLLLYPIWRRRWRMAAGVVLGLVLALLVLPAAAMGPRRTSELYREWVEVLAKPALGHGTDTSRARELTGMGSTDNQSLLAFIHNWRYHSLPHRERPVEAAPSERYEAYVAGALMLVGILLAAGTRRHDSSRELVLTNGLLVALSLVVSPIVHNFYYLLMMPLVTVLLERGLGGETRTLNWSWLSPLLIFMVIDLAARLPGIGPWLRDAGFPCLSLVYVMGSAAVALVKPSKNHELTPINTNGGTLVCGQHSARTSSNR